MRRALRITAICTLLLAIGCATTRRPVPLGAVPSAPPVSQDDLAYGQQVLGMLTQQFPLSRDDHDITLVRDIVELITQKSKTDHDPWHAYVLVDDTIANAGATRGNYIFVWSGLLRSLRSKEELATILAHEIGHVLAGHTRATPQEEANKMISNVAGVAAREVLRSQSAAAGQFAGLAEGLITQAVRGFIVNPEEQRQELEADQIGLFLLAEAGFHPRKAVEFWERVQHDPRFGANSLEFFSSHPTSRTRLEHLRSILHNAESRYRRVKASKTTTPTNASEWTLTPPITPSRAHRTEKASVWLTEHHDTLVFAEATRRNVSHRLPRNTSLLAQCRMRDALRITRPVQGYVSVDDILPRNASALAIAVCEPGDSSKKKRK